MPLDYRPYATRIGEFARDVEKKWFDRAEKTGDPAPAFAALARSIETLRAAADTAFAAQAQALASGDRAALDASNTRLMQAERALLDPAGIPGRPWYRHQIYAPKFTYAPELLPGVAEAVETGDAARVSAQVERLIAALERAARTLTVQVDDCGWSWRLEARELEVGSWELTVGHLPNCTVFPVRADSRAASRISVTIRLFSSDERPEGVTRAADDAYEIASSSCDLAAAGPASTPSSGLPGSRTRSEPPPVAMA